MIRTCGNFSHLQSQTIPNGPLLDVACFPTPVKAYSGQGWILSDTIERNILDLAVLQILSLSSRRIRPEASSGACGEREAWTKGDFMSRLVIHMSKTG